jgi:cytosine/uracil/thiamine/allantoin permease
MARVKAKHARALADEPFGDPDLVNVELAPVAVHRRILSFGRLVPLWGAVAVTPATYAFACRPLPVAPALLALAFGLAVTDLLGVALSRTAGRYGVGFAPLC